MTPLAELLAMLGFGRATLACKSRLPALHRPGVLDIGTFWFHENGNKSCAHSVAPGGFFTDSNREVVGVGRGEGGNGLAN